MRKRTVITIADHLFWLIVALLPILLFVVQFFSYELTTTSESLPTFISFMEQFGISDMSIIYVSLQDIFGAEGILPLFGAGSNVLLTYMTYFVVVEIVHLAVDFLVFIPKLCHKWMDSMTGFNN